MIRGSMLLEKTESLQVASLTARAKKKRLDRETELLNRRMSEIKLGVHRTLINVGFYQELILNIDRKIPMNISRVFKIKEDALPRLGSRYIDIKLKEKKVIVIEYDANSDFKNTIAYIPYEKLGKKRWFDAKAEARRELMKIKLKSL